MKLSDVRRIWDSKIISDTLFDDIVDDVLDGISILKIVEFRHVKRELVLQIANAVRDDEEVNPPDSACVSYQGFRLTPEHLFRLKIVQLERALEWAKNGPNYRPNHNF